MCGLSLSLSLSLSPAARSARSVADNMVKLQEDRAYLERVVRKTAAEVAERGTFNTLSTALQQYSDNKEAMETEILESVCETNKIIYFLCRLVYREERCRKRVSELKRQLVEVRRSKEKELSVRNRC